MFANKYLNLGYVSMIAIILGLAITTSYVNTAQAADKKKVELKIKGMGCEMCAKAIEKVVSRCTGVMGCHVSLKEGKATIEVEVGKAKAGEVIDAIEDAGFDVPEWDIPELY